MKRILGLMWFYKLPVLAVVGLVAGGVLVMIGQHIIAYWVLGTVSIVETLPLLARMWQDIRLGKYGIDILAATAIVASVILQQYWVAIIIVIMLTGGESLENFAATRARSELKDLLKRTPQIAHVLRKRKVVDVHARDVHVHEKIILRPGEVVPVDAVILEGIASFDEASLTGESLPQTKGVHDHILSGSVCLDGEITAKTLRSARDSQYEQIIRLVQGASAHPAPFIRLADRYSIPFTILAYAIAGAAWFVSHQPIRFLEVIVVATPCPLLLAAPIALIAGMSRASRDGIIIKTGRALEQLAQARTFAFDKTGTLTLGRPTVDMMVAFRPFTKDMLLAYAAGVEQSSNHVLARAIVAAANARHLKSPKAKQAREVAGLGLRATTSGKEILVGRLDLMRRHQIMVPKQLKAVRVAQTVSYVAVGGDLTGYITFKDELRPEAKQTLQTLLRLGVKRTLMVTGDSRATAKNIAAQLGITDIKAEALPGDKLLAIEAIPDHPLVFVGDGVNDAPVLTAADVGIALGARGSTAASESADVVIMQDDLAYVGRAVMIAKRAFHIARQSILVGICISVALMLVFATGKFSPVIGAILQEAVDVIVILNALRAHSATYNQQN